MSDKNWKEILRLAKHYKAIGFTDHWLSREENAPWHLVTDISADGSLVRMGLTVAINFRAKDPKTGMTFRWCVDIETRAANGASKFLIDVPRLRAIKQNLSAENAKKFKHILAEKAQAVRKCGDEYNKTATEQFVMAQQLE